MNENTPYYLGMAGIVLVVAIAGFLLNGGTQSNNSGLTGAAVGISGGPTGMTVALYEELPSSIGACGLLGPGGVTHKLNVKDRSQINSYITLYSEAKNPVVCELNSCIGQGGYCGECITTSEGISCSTVSSTINGGCPANAYCIF